MAGLNLAQSGYEFEVSRVASRSGDTYASTALRLLRAQELYVRLNDQITAIGESWTGYPPSVRAPASAPDAFEIAYSPADIAQELTNLTMLSSEIVHHVRAALDYCAYQTVHRDRGRPRSGTQFPLFDDKSRFADGLKRYMPGITHEHKIWVEEAQPYNNVRWTSLLKEFSNRDKHRTPIEVVDVFTFSIDPSRVFLDPLGDPNYLGYQVEQVSIIFRISDFDEGVGNDHEITDVLSELILGGVRLANRFLVDAGEPPIQIIQGDREIRGPQSIPR